MTSRQATTTEPGDLTGQWSYATRTCVALLLMIVCFFAPYFAELLSIHQAAKAIPISIIVAAGILAIFEKTRGWASAVATAAVSAGLVRLLFESAT